MAPERSTATNPVGLVLQPSRVRCASFGTKRGATNKLAVVEFDGFQFAFLADQSRYRSVGNRHSSGSQSRAFVGGERDLVGEERHIRRPLSE